jgi:hypothetical protein
MNRRRCAAYMTEFEARVRELSRPAVKSCRNYLWPSTADRSRDARLAKAIRVNDGSRRLPKRLPPGAPPTERGGVSGEAYIYPLPLAPFQHAVAMPDTAMLDTPQKTFVTPSEQIEDVSAVDFARGNLTVLQKQAMEVTEANEKVSAILRLSITALRKIAYHNGTIQFWTSQMVRRKTDPRFRKCRIADIA